MAFEILVQGQTATANADREILIDPELVVRESTGPAPEA